MALGIVLHGALTFIPGAWPITDASVKDDGTPFAMLVAAIHGFRMPLFFLLSGFFTAMLWRHRGLWSLVRHRAQRLLLPLALAMLIVTPLMWGAWGYVDYVSNGEEEARTGAKIEVKAVDNVWAAAALGNVAALEHHVDAGALLNAFDPTFGVTPLSWAALHGRTEAAAWLLANGAAVGARNRDGATALHAAAFMGRPELVELLLERGADASAVDVNGVRPLDSSHADAATTKWLAELLGLSYEEGALGEGRQEVRRLLAGAAEQTEAAGGVAPYRDGADANVDRERNLLVPWYWSLLYSGEWGDLFTVDFFGHLWFLWYLVWLAGGFALIAWVAAKLGVRGLGLPKSLVVTPALYVWAVPLTMTAQYLMGIEGQIPEFGPDTYTGLVPVPHVLLYYAIFFGFGAAYFGRNDGGVHIGQWWQLALPLALVVFLAGVTLTFPEEGGIARGWARAGSLFLQAAYAWMMTLGLIGLFRATLGEGNARVRYLSDASYWLYLMHLPVIVVLQALVQDWPLPATLKLALMAAVTASTLLLVYHWGVRYTAIGRLLNGPRMRMRAAAVTP